MICDIFCISLSERPSNWKGEYRKVEEEPIPVSTVSDMMVGAVNLIRTPFMLPAHSGGMEEAMEEAAEEEGAKGERRDAPKPV